MIRMISDSPHELMGLTMHPTPLEHAPRLSKILSIDLWIKRDDLLPIPGGGNKVRKLSAYIDAAEMQGATALITNGGMQSNHARVTALCAAAKGWRCCLALHGDPNQSPPRTGNYLLMLLTGASITIVPPEQIASTIERFSQRLLMDGHKPMIIPGGAHGLKGAMAYVQAVQELQAQCDSCGWRPEVVLLPSGTGTTQAGIIAGIRSLGWDTHVIGVSVARRNPRGSSVLAASLSELETHLALRPEADDIDFRDAWVGAGYEQADEHVWEAVRLAGNEEGLVLDPTYTGKAFAALVDLARSNQLAEGARVLFWHTGGLLNLEASRWPWS